MMPVGTPLSDHSGLDWVRASTRPETHPSEVASLRWSPCRRVKGLELAVTRGNLTKMRVDAIASAAGSHQLCSTGVGAAIVAAGGRQIVDDCRAWIEEHGQLATSQAMSTRAGNLPCSHVIHVVGPSVRGSRPTPDHAQALRAAVRSALFQATSLGISSIAIPGISSGGFGYPKELATTEIVNECVRYMRGNSRRTTIKTIVFVDTDKSTSAFFALALRDVAVANGRIHALEYADKPLTVFQADDAAAEAKKLRVPLPSLSPPAPLELVSPGDPEYESIIAELPVEMASRVVSVRRVHVPDHHSQYEKTKRDLERTGAVEKEPLYHGTPHRWRATAIALSGFDLSLRLNGRSYGDGVYTSDNVDTAVHYTKYRGSLLRLRGLVCDNTIKRNAIYVFPNPAALLSLTIIDYAAEDEQDRMLAQGH